MSNLLCSFWQSSRLIQLWNPKSNIFCVSFKIHLVFTNGENQLSCHWQWLEKTIVRSYPAGNYLFKISNRNTIIRCERCSKLTIKTPERRHRRCSGVFIVNFEHISHFVLVFLLLIVSSKMLAGFHLLGYDWTPLCRNTCEKTMIPHYLNTQFGIILQIRVINKNNR